MRVARTLKGLNHRNTLVLRKLKLYFQCFPGKHGSDEQRGIGGVDYVLKVGGRVVDKGKTGPDGSVEVSIPAEPPATLEIFGTTYDLQMINFLNSMDGDNPTADMGFQQRLSMLGYHVGSIDGDWGNKSARAAANFQTDEGLEVNGLQVSDNVIRATGTPSKLQSTFGE